MDKIRNIFKRFKGPAYIEKTPLISEQMRSDALQALNQNVGPRSIPRITPLLFSENNGDVLNATYTINSILSSCNPKDLLWLDERIRSSYLLHFPYFELRRPIPPEKLAKWVGPGEPGDFLVKFSSLHSNGFIREEAVKKLALLQDGSEVPFLLIRLNDWVPHVRKRAETAILKRIRENYAEFFVRNLFLVLRLEKTERIDHSSIVKAIIDLLSAPNAIGKVIAGMKGEIPSDSRGCFKILIKMPDSMRLILTEAKDANDPIIRLWAVQEAQHAQEAADIKAILTSLDKDPFPPIRKELLAVWERRFPNESHKHQLNGLLDKSSGVRDLARYNMRRANLDFAEFYRARLSVTSTPLLHAAISGLGETGSEEDAKYLLPFLTNDSARIRRLAIRGVARSSKGAHLPLIFEMLNDPSPGVSTEARKAVEPHVVNIGPEKLWDAFKKGNSPHSLRNTLMLIANLPKWTSISFLIKACDTDMDGISIKAKELIKRWIARYNRNQTSPSKEQCMKLHDVLKNHGARLDEKLFDWLRSTLDSFNNTKGFGPCS